MSTLQENLYVCMDIVKTSALFTKGDAGPAARHARVPVGKLIAGVLAAARPQIVMLVLDA